MPKSSPQYSFSFITGALFLKESAAVAGVVAAEPDTGAAAAVIRNGNLLRQRTRASETRLLREIRHRIDKLSHAELTFFVAGSPREQAQLLFIAVCRHFRFIREFVDEVILPRFMSFDHQIYPGDFQRFWDQKALEAPDMEKLSEKSRAKIRQVLLRMLVEAGLLDSPRTCRLISPTVSGSLHELLRVCAPDDLRFLLVSQPALRQ